MTMSSCCCRRYLSKAGLFMLGLFFTHGYVEYAFLSVTIDFVKEIIGKDIFWYNVVVSTSLEGTTALWASFLAYSNYAQKYPIRTILITQGIFLSGLLSLWLIRSPNIGIIYLLLGLLALGKAGRRIITSFLECQLKLELDKDNGKEKKHEKDQKSTKFCWCIRQKPEEDEDKKHEKSVQKRRKFCCCIRQKPEEDEEKKHEKRVQKRTNIWSWIGYLPGIITAVAISSSPWKLKFMIGAIAMGIGYVSFCFGLMYYEPATQTSEDNQSRKKWHRWQHLKLFPLWTPFLAYYVIQASGSTLFMEQVDVLEKEFEFLAPEISLVLVKNIISLLTGRVLKSKCFLYKNWKHHVRLTVGLVFSFCCCIASWNVEARRLRPGSRMSIFWLLPQFFLLGFTTGLVGGSGLQEFFLYLVPGSWEDLEFAFNKLVEGMAKFITVVFIILCRNWIRNDIKTSRLDNYYRTLAFLNFVALFLFIFLSNTIDWNIQPERTDTVRRGTGDATSNDEFDRVIEIVRAGQEDADKDKNPEKIEEGRANLVPESSR